MTHLSSRKTISLILILCTYNVTATPMIKLKTDSQTKIQYTHQETEYYSEQWNTEIVTNVSQPSLEVYQAEGKGRTDTAVIIAPGGALYAHSIESEGRLAAKWLNNKGITAFVLKYRLVPTEIEAISQLNKDRNTNYKTVLDKASKVLPYAIQDGLNAVQYVRENAKTYEIDPNKIGFLGFSAGGAVALGVSYQYNKANKPNFLIPVYPWTDVIDIEQPKPDAPSVAIVCASNDSERIIEGSVKLYESYIEAGKTAEIHMYSKGGHGFGMKQQNLPSDKWIERVYDWLETEGWLVKKHPG